MIWSIAVITSWFLVIQLLIHSIMRIYGTEVNTQITIEKRRIMQFPSVTICNYNQYRKSYFLSADNYSKSLLLSMYPNYLGYGRSLIKINQTAIPGFNATRVFLESAHQIQGMILYCVWQNRPENCSGLFKTVLTDHGVCYTFNSDGARMQSTAGSLYGLRLVVMIQHSEYFYSETMGKTGVKVTFKLSFVF